MNPLKVGIAQINTMIGDLKGNAEKILRAYRKLVEEGAEVVLTPELSLCGYSPMDLVFRAGFVEACERQLEELMSEVGEVPLIVGTVEASHMEYGRPCYNCAVVLQNAERIATARKSLIPMYDIFDEGRYFEPAQEVTMITIEGRRIALAVCEDVWPKQYMTSDFYGYSPLEMYARHGAEMILFIAASLFETGKLAKRFGLLKDIIATYPVPIAGVNLVGGNGQLIFDGSSFACDKEGRLIAQFPAFVEHCAVVEVGAGAGMVAPKIQTDIDDLYSALVIGLRDYVAKSGFEKVMLGLGGGIDSAVVAALAVEAVGAKNVVGVTMPGPFSSEGSVEDSRVLASNLGIEFKEISINPGYDVLCEQLSGEFAGKAFDVAEENLQSRLRGITLMALSNKSGHMVLSTGNKSELAMGYCTLYGDMVGAIAPLSDVLKTRVYELARFINRKKEIIPQATIDKAPSAELRPNQKDQDSLPPYEILDEIIRLYVEEFYSVEQIVKCGFDLETVNWVAAKIESNEYKRRQAALPLKVTKKAFGGGRRIPVIHKFCDCISDCR